MLVATLLVTTPAGALVGEVSDRFTILCNLTEVFGAAFVSSAFVVSANPQMNNGNKDSVFISSASNKAAPEKLRPNDPTAI